MQFNFKFNRLSAQAQENITRTATLNGMKTRVKEIYEENKQMKKQMAEIIRMSGFKFKHIYDEMKMSSKTFDTRMKTGNWKDNEIKKLIEILKID